ncbi:anti-sigma factor antagonist [Streptomyces roseoverticillatus]|uniref:anti-sigma factor antagonist n=1 Tax=Streptomyces roseoverticillatus TaxID=66429 RepID=UPI001F2FDB18|nr:anti-sigma factor antagonist [Streptomyces roseoverticillatus]MCF3106802.1 anti-sigma factor antagonist [Streptomyces roseoverticillatus]
MTIAWRYTDYPTLGILSVSGYLSGQATARLVGAVGWVEARGTGSLILDLTALKGWSVEGQDAIAQAAARLADAGRAVELAAIPADGSLVPGARQPHIPVHPDLISALAAHHIHPGRAGRQWRTSTWPEDTPHAG